MNEAWEKTNNEWCLKPTFDIICKQCGGEMQLRHSAIETDSDLRAYKCKKCCWFIRFQVFVESEYLQEIQKLRGNIDTWIPVESYLNEEENEIIAKRLKALGYF